jgi:phage terminase Nu1 subunit (DNA packaging protein)
MAWRAANVAPRKGGPKAERPTGELQEALIRAQVAKLEAEAEAKELKNAQLRGELYDAEETEQAVSMLTSMIRNRLEAVPAEIEMEFPPEIRQQVKELVDTKLRLVLMEMSQWRMSQ